LSESLGEEMQQLRLEALAMEYLAKRTLWDSPNWFVKIGMVALDRPSVESRDRSDKLGQNLFNWRRFRLRPLSPHENLSGLNPQ
jgi:hypothetical protein